MKKKLIVMMGTVALAAWMGASFVAPAGVADPPVLGESAESSDSHREGSGDRGEVVLPSGRVDLEEPNLFLLLTAEG